MPADGEKRGSISHVFPSGWKSADGKNNNNNQYDSKVVPGGYIYNRCHLIGWQLSAENANKSNLITGTQYMNIQGMVPFENMIADYIKETGNHVMYRVTPIFDGDNLLASGVHLEAYSVEDEGEGICFSVYVYNVQPGIKINYATGENKLDDSSDSEQTTETTQKTETTGSASSGDYTYVLNKNSGLIHLPTCPSLNSMSEKNREETNKTFEELIADGKKACKTCKPS
jgi:DNA-entry nuclease